MLKWFTHFIHYGLNVLLTTNLQLLHLGHHATTNCLSYMENGDHPV